MGFGRRLDTILTCDMMQGPEMESQNRVFRAGRMLRFAKGLRFRKLWLLRGEPNLLERRSTSSLASEARSAITRRAPDL